MKLSELLKPWFESLTFDEDVLGLENDSRKVQPGVLFLAYPGAKTDGRLFIADAIKAGAAAVLYEPQNGPQQIQPPETIKALAVPNLSAHLAAMASRFYQYPTEALTVTGVTGTNGKTTIAYQLAQAYTLLGNKAAYIGTIGQGQVNHLSPLMNTTPDAICLQRLFADYRDEGMTQVCMEVSSHALAQQRVDGIVFEQAIFTNLTHDHLDYHQTLDAYAKAKALLFEKPMLKWAIVNEDDHYAALMRESITSPSCQVLRYGMNKKDADVRAVDCSIALAGSRFNLISPWGESELTITSLGLFNVYNALAVCSSLLAQGIPFARVIKVMEQVTSVPGRMEIVSCSPYVIVDYAHTPDALENVLVTLNQLKKGRLIVVFGCGGDRDKAKRPMMGAVASQHAEEIILTSDNPRSEDPMLIIKDILTGIPSQLNVSVIVDRKEAILKAIERSETDDIIVVAGKGHEDYQQIGTTRFAFSDQKIITGI